MKKIKILLPVLAFVFAITVAFATSTSNSQVDCNLWEKQGDDCRAVATTTVNEPSTGTFFQTNLCEGTKVTGYSCD